MLNKKSKKRMQQSLEERGSTDKDKQPPPEWSIRKDQKGETTHAGSRDTDTWGQKLTKVMLKYGI